MSLSSSESVCMTGASNCSNSGPARKHSPVATIRRPLRFSGRRRHAIRPHAANDPPTRRNATSHAGGGGPRPPSAGSSAPSAAAIVTPQRRTQTHGRCREAKLRIERA